MPPPPTSIGGKCIMFSGRPSVCLSVRRVSVCPSVRCPTVRPCVRWRLYHVNNIFVLIGRWISIKPSHKMHHARGNYWKGFWGQRSEDNVICVKMYIMAKAYRLFRRCSVGAQMVVSMLLIHDSFWACRSFASRRSLNICISFRNVSNRYSSFLQVSL